MDGDVPHPAVWRLRRDHELDHALTVLGQLPGADFTAVMLDVVARRADAVTAADVVAQYQRDRFVRPAFVDPTRTLQLELRALTSLSSEFEHVPLAPLVPLGTHSVIAGVHQNRVVTTVRGTEVAADPTNGLALEAAIRRRSLLSTDPRCTTPVHLAATQRIVRAQQFSDARSFAHFVLIGLVSAGRDIGSHNFETQMLQLHLEQLIAIARRADVTVVTISLTDFGGRHTDVLDAAMGALASDDVVCIVDPDRVAARGYYPSVCFKMSVVRNDDTVEVADGGIVPWTQSLVGSNKERLMISGLSLERLALLVE